MRFPILLAPAMLAALAGPVASAEPARPEQPTNSATCIDGERPIRRYDNWSAKSDAICDYGFLEANRRLTGLLEAPSGGVGIDWLKTTLGIPRFIQREGWEPNDFFVIKAGYQVALAGQDGWEMVIEAYQFRREGAWGRKDDFNVKFHSTGLTPQMEEQLKGRCISEAEVLDRAVAAGWRYVPGYTGSGTAGPIFVPGALAKDDGRRLRLINLSQTIELPSRAKLEATCAWIFSFSELVETRK